MGDELREWRDCKLGDVLELKRGYDLPSQHRHPGPVPIVSSSGPSGFHSEAMVKAPGVVTGRYGTIGEVFFVTQDFWPLNTTLYVRDFKGSDPKFVSYFLKTIDFYSCSDKAAVPGVNRNHLHELPVRVPPLAEQRAIACILGALDDKIELNRKISATLEAIARALFKSWFVDFDPVRAKAEGRAPSAMDAETAKLFPSEFVDSEHGSIPKGWTVVPVYDIATYVNGAAYKAFQPNDERRGLPIIKIAELKAGVTAQTKFSEVAMPEKYRLRTGDILFSWSGNPDTSIDTFVWAHGEAWLNQHIFRVDFRTPTDRSFVLATLKCLRPVFAEIARNKQTTGLGHVTAGDMQRLLVVKPDPGVLGAWDRVAAPLFATVFRNELESLSLARLRDELLPRLLSGALDVGPLATGTESING
jgi:type I restriction enzyme S subunit